MLRNIIAVLCLGSLICIGGCSQKTETVTPDTDIIPTNQQPAEMEVSQSVATLTEYSLQDLMVYTVKTSPRIRTAVADFASAGYDTELIKLQNQTTVGLSGEVMTGSVSDNTVSLDVGRTISSFGRSAAEIQASQLLETVAAGRVGVAHFETKEQLVDYYFDWWMASRIHEIRSRNTREAQLVLDRIERQVEIGIVSSADYTSAGSQIDQLQRSLRAAEMDLTAALSDLSFFVGVDLDIEKLGRNLPISKPSQQITQNDIDSAISKDIRLLTFDREHDAVSAQQRQIALSGRPTIRAVARMSLEEPFTSQRMSQRGFGLSLDVPLNSKAQTEAQMGQLSSQLERLEARRTGREREIRMTMRIMQRSLKDYILGAPALRSARDRTIASLASNKRQFENGASDWRPYLSSINEVALIDIELARKEIAAHAAAARFDLIKND
jgi:outer membrane protein TolC